MSLRLIVCSAGLCALFTAFPSAAVERVTDGGFDNTYDEAWWTDGIPSGEVRDGALCVDLPGGTGEIWALGVGQSGIELTEGVEYVFSFRATGTPGGRLRAIVQLPRDPWTEYVQIDADVTSAGDLYQTKFTSPVTMDEGQLAFQVGGSNEPWTFCVDEVSINDEVPVAPETPIPGPPSAGDANPVATGPRVRVNQLGYLPDGPKKATIVTDAAQPLPFVVKDELGTDVFEGMTEPRGFDISAGLNVHVADFSAFSQDGEDYTLAADEDASYPFDIDVNLYDELRIDALSTFYPQRSGIEIEADIAGRGYGRPAGHLASPGSGETNQGDLDVPCLPADALQEAYGEPWTCDYTLDAVGGWYDAGDHGKYVVAGGLAVGQLLATHARIAAIDTFTAPNAEGLDALGDGSLRIPEDGNGLPDVLDEALWELQFFLEMKVPDGQPMAGMVHHKLHDADWTDIPLLPHADGEPRYLHRPSTSATLNTAATMAMAARLYDPALSAFPATALAEAEAAWQAALANPEIYAPSTDAEGGGAYADDDVTDEFYWAAAELFITTGKPEYLDALRTSRWWTGEPFNPDGFEWGYVQGFAQLEMATNLANFDDADAGMIRASVLKAADMYLDIIDSQPFGHAYAPSGGRYNWGSNYLALQNAIVVATAYDISGEEKYRQAALETMDYILGRNALNISYVTGYGTVFSQNQHSSIYAHSLDASLPRPPRGSLAGGPNSSIDDDKAQALFAENGCAPQACYVDDIESWSTNELAIGWNAALAQFASWLADQ